jgi:hypothetical protein
VASFAIEQTMIVAVSTFHFGRQTRLSTHKDKREFETQVARLFRINAVCAADFQDDSALLISVDGSPSQGTQPKIVKFTCTPKVIAIPSEMVSAR